MKVLLLSFILLCVFSCQPPAERRAEGGDTLNAEKRPAIPDEEEGLYALIQSSGLTEREKNMLQVNAEFQALAGEDAYFLLGDHDFSDYWGACVFLKGEPVDNLPDTSQNTAYGRKVLQVDSIATADYENCSYPRQNAEEIRRRYSRIEPEKLNGFVKRMRRPAPDIGYDYLLELSEPLRVQNDPFVGDGAIEEIPVTPLNLEMLAQLEGFIDTNMEVAAEGMRIPGYAEQTVFQLFSLSPAYRVEAP